MFEAFFFLARDSISTAGLETASLLNDLVATEFLSKVRLADETGIALPFASSHLRAL
jgi:hypothetical protein